MKLQDLFTLLNADSSSLPDVSISGVFNDARQVEENSVFVAIVGGKADGHDFVVDAIHKGALVLVVEKMIEIPASFKGYTLIVQNSRQALDLIASNFYGNPTKKMYCVGITGTNGKTSTSYMIEYLLNSYGLTTGVIGTINHHLREKIWPSDMTTPDPISLQRRLAEFLAEGAKAVAMEVSSHALDQRRADGVDFDTAIFTNLTRDHLDYHRTMESYFQAKERLFSEILKKSTKRIKTAILNYDDGWHFQIPKVSGVKRWTYGSSELADFQYEILSVDFTKTMFRVYSPFGEHDFILPMMGKHNIQNMLAAMIAASTAGMPWARIPEAVKGFTGVPGRLQLVPNKHNKAVFVDYAHTPDALVNVLTSIAQVRSEIKSSSHIWTVFGCGGDRDKGKRPEMARVAANCSDFVIVTSDNPRTEEPEAIIKDILAGIHTADRKKIFTEVDREKAIQMAIEKSQTNDVVLIAGKGHEDYQIIGDKKFPFSDFEIARKYLEKN